jgi:hypothetical protein
MFAELRGVSCGASAKKLHRQLGIIPAMTV